MGYEQSNRCEPPSFSAVHPRAVTAGGSRCSPLAHGYAITLLALRTRPERRAEVQRLLTPARGVAYWPPGFKPFGALENHREYMRYNKARALGLPVGSGNVEVTCKSLFEVRLKRPGCRFKTDSGAHLVDLRALALSDRYAQALTLALAPFRRHVAVLSTPPASLSCAG